MTLTMTHLTHIQSGVSYLERQYVLGTAHENQEFITNERRIIELTGAVVFFMISRPIPDKAEETALAQRSLRNYLPLSQELNILFVREDYARMEALIKQVWNQDELIQNLSELADSLLSIAVEDASLDYAGMYRNLVQVLSEQVVEKALANMW